MAARFIPKGDQVFELSDKKFEVAPDIFGKGDKLKFSGAKCAEEMNLSTLIYKNTSTSHYMRNELAAARTLPEIIWHIGTYVKHLEAWERSNALLTRGSKYYGGVRGVAENGALISSAFTIMVRIHQLHITLSDLYELAKFKNNDYVCAIALLYARHVLDPSNLFKFYRHFIGIRNRRPINITNDDSVSMTIGELAEYLLTNNRWYGNQILPHIPIKVMEGYKEQITEYTIISKHQGNNDVAEVLGYNPNQKKSGNNRRERSRSPERKNGRKSPNYGKHRSRSPKRNYR